MLSISMRTSNKGQVLVSPRGMLVAGENTEKMRVLLKDLIPGHTDVVVNMSGLDRIDAAGMGALVGAYFAGRNQGARVSFCNVPSRTLELFELVGLRNVFEPGAESCLCPAA